MASHASLKGYLPATAFVMAKKVTPASHSLESSLESTATQPQPHVALTADLIFLEASPTLVGASRELLTKMIAAMALQPSVVAVATVPEFPEGLAHGKVWIALGEPAAQTLLASTLKLSELRAKVHRLPSGDRVIATFHPQYLLENPQAKKDAWEDLKLAMRELSVSSS